MKKANTNKTKCVFFSKSKSCEAFYLERFILADHLTMPEDICCIMDYGFYERWQRRDISVFFLFFFPHYKTKRFVFCAAEISMYQSVSHNRDGLIGNCSETLKRRSISVVLEKTRKKDLICGGILSLYFSSLIVLNAVRSKTIGADRPKMVDWENLFSIKTKAKKKKKKKE